MTTQDIYSSASARKICTLLYGKAIHPSTWASWRKLADIDSNQKRLTKHQYLLVCAIAYIRSIHPKKHLTWSFVEPVMLEIELHIAAALKRTSAAYKIANKAIKPSKESRLIKGRDIPSYLKSRGINPPHISTVYRKIAGFSLEEYYSDRQVLAIFKHHKSIQSFNRTYKIRSLQFA
jgi:hypothetical protein